MSFFKKYGNRMIVTIVAIILIIIIGITAGGRERISSVENTIGNILTPIQKFFYNAGESVSTTFRSVANITKLKEENEALREQVAKLEKDNREMEDIIGRTEFLRNEALLKENTVYSLVDSQIIGRDYGNWFDRFVIDKGEKDGIKKGDPVVQGVVVEGSVIEEGLVGIVSEVGDNWAKVISIIDEGSNVSFNIIRTQDGGIVSGNIDGNIEGYLFDSKADAVKGDKLITSGLGGVYIQGLFIGEINDVTKKSDELMKNISVTPAVNFSKLNEVYVIIGNK